MTATNRAEALRKGLNEYADTRAMLMRQPAMFARLAQLVALYAPRGQWWRFRCARGITVSAGQKKARVLVGAAQRLERLLLDRETAVLLTYGGLQVRPEIAALPRALRALVAEAKGVLEVPSGRRRGRPLDPWRERFCQGVARVLLDHGEKVSKTHEARRPVLFATVLRCCFEAAGESPPVDLFPLIRRAADAVREGGDIRRPRE